MDTKVLKNIEEKAFFAGLYYNVIQMRKKTKKTIKYAIIAIICLAAYPLMNGVFSSPPEGTNLSTRPTQGKNLHEADYVKAYCKGEIEHVLKDNTRIDCLTETYACEFDWAKKWYEGVGQALWYSYNTGKKPCLVLILKTQKDEIYYNRAKLLCDKHDIHLEAIRAGEKTDDIAESEIPKQSFVPAGIKEFSKFIDSWTSKEPFRLKQVS